jgi:hypothetical protein
VIATFTGDSACIVGYVSSRYCGPLKNGDQAGTQWRQDMQVDWLRAAVRAQERRDDPEINFETLRLPSSNRKLFLNQS